MGIIILLGLLNQVAIKSIKYRHLRTALTQRVNSHVLLCLRHQNSFWHFSFKM